MESATLDYSNASEACASLDGNGKYVCHHFKLKLTRFFYKLQPNKSSLNRDLLKGLRRRSPKLFLICSPRWTRTRLTFGSDSTTGLTSTFKAVKRAITHVWHTDSSEMNRKSEKVIFATADLKLYAHSFSSLNASSSSKAKRALVRFPEWFVESQSWNLIREAPAPKKSTCPFI